ncbi:AbiH family protein [Anaerocolumna sp. MB42-C2]|uniref:AbiH family protein n=1 Tax=Anaerocolumna sp. MB42-C2 TaxID=3070997 RepID=UPI0027E1F94E|nr:AbiH family protein [Anaerocolumna sp. MB42-C2]WMJ89448.1 AbiH family protein [Anaerocolumna sp. MB42-C2]
MKILVIGNGFDLAHQLPTTYADFLEFIRVVNSLLNGETLESVDWGYLNKIIKRIITDDVFLNDNGIHNNKAMWQKLIGYNFWVEYFWANQSYINENWIDFESEIGTVIKSLENDIKGSIKDEIIVNGTIQISNKYLSDFYCRNNCSNALKYNEDREAFISFEGVRNRLLGDLNNLIRAFELYLTLFVDKIEIEKKSMDIEGIKPDSILSFNYTDTYKKVYNFDKEIEYDYIHGKAISSRAVEDNNMVLGIDEYLHKDKRDSEVSFIGFKKYYQRIFKGTGCKYKDWLVILQHQVQEKEPVYGEMIDKGAHELYIFGHSCDITDKDILSDLILNKWVQTTIFYYDKDDLGRKITNLVKVIGQNELIQRTGGPTKTITFKLQSPMKLI